MEITALTILWQDRCSFVLYRKKGTRKIFSMKLKILESLYLGYIVCGLRPYFFDAMKSDSEIMKNIIYNNRDKLPNGIRSVDALVVDRGFPDFLPFLQS